MQQLLLRNMCSVLLNKEAEEIKKVPDGSIPSDTL